MTPTLSGIETRVAADDMTPAAYERLMDEALTQVHGDERDEVRALYLLAGHSYGTRLAQMALEWDGESVDDLLATVEALEALAEVLTRRGRYATTLDAWLDPGMLGHRGHGYVPDRDDVYAVDAAGRKLVLVTGTEAGWRVESADDD